MQVPADPARCPQAPETGAKRDAETLAWFGTAYGRRVARDKPSLLPANVPAHANSSSLTAALKAGKPERPPNRNRRRYAPIILLFAVLSALLVLRLLPLAPPPNLEPVRDPSPAEAAPVIEASRETAPGVPSSPIDTGRVTNVEVEPAGAPTAQRQEALHQEVPRQEMLHQEMLHQEMLHQEMLHQEIQQPLVQIPALSRETPSAMLEPAASSAPPAALPPLIPLEAAKAPEIEVRTVAAPVLAPVTEPDPVAVSEGRLSAPLPSAVVKAKLSKSDLPPSPPLNTPGKNRTNPDLAIGNVLFARGDLLAARTAFEKAFEMGLPEAALALGNTFDPVSLSKAGVRDKGDPAVARRWYRRAFELAMSRPAMSRPAMSSPTMRRPGRHKP